MPGKALVKTTTTTASSRDGDETVGVLDLVRLFRLRVPCTSSFIQCRRFQAPRLFRLSVKAAGTPHCPKTRDFDEKANRSTVCNCRESLKDKSRVSSVEV